MKEQIDFAKIPTHVAIIMDGNGRWAKKRGASRLFGHQSAIKAVRESTEGCAELGVERLTLYAFSTENWGRPKSEVDGLMTLLISTIKKEIPTLMKNDITLQPIGDVSHLPKEARKNLELAIEQTQDNKKMVLSLALNYSGRWEIADSVSQLLENQRQKGNSKLSNDDIQEYIGSKMTPDVELMIRTSGEQRISNFLLWQTAYAELYFTDTLWPDFRKKDLHNAILDFQSRERRYGKISEQLI